MNCNLVSDLLITKMTVGADIDVLTTEDTKFDSDAADDAVDDARDQKTILQNLRYFSRKELVQYVSHAGEDDDNVIQSSMFAPATRDKGHFHSDHATATVSVSERPKRHSKLVRFNSRPQIHRDDTQVNYDSLKDVHDRPSKPKPSNVDHDDNCRAATSLHFPPLKQHIIDAERQTSVKSLSSRSTDALGSSNAGHKRLNAKAKKYLANVTPHHTSLGCSPPQESMLRKVLTRGSFGSSGSSQLTTSRRHEQERASRIHNPHKLRSNSMRWASPKRCDDRSHNSSDSERSSSPARDDVNRELMTSPLTTLQLRDAMGSGMSADTTDSLRVPESSSQYPVLSADEHLEFIKYALTPSLGPNQRETSRDRASTIGGGEKPDYLVRRKRFNKLSNSLSNSNSSFSSMEKINIEKKYESSKPYIKRPLHL